MAISKSLLASDPAHLRAAFADLGLTEKPGRESAERIDQMFHDSGNPGRWDDSVTAWCAAAVGAWLHDAGLKGTGSLAARSYMSFGTATDSPKRGDIAVFRRGNSSWEGHVAVFLGRDKGRVWVIGGNQSNAVTVASYPESSLLGYRRVPAASQPIPEPKEADMAKVVPILRRGASGPRVTDLQKQIAVLGFNPGAIDGEFGTNTEKAVRAFQERLGLEVDGEVGPHTQAAIEEMLAKARTAAKPAPVEYTPTEARPIPAPAEPVGGRSAPAVPDAPRSPWVAILALLVVGALALAGAFLGGGL